MISPEKWKQLRGRMERLKVREADLNERFVVGSGKGGQKINKTASCVQLTHTVSGVEVRSQRTRSQSDNRYWARRELCDRIEEKILGAQSARQQKIEKIRRQKRRRSRRAKARMLDDKRHQSQKKQRRSSVRLDGD